MKLLIEPKINDPNTKYDLEQLTIDLEKLYTTLNKKDEKEDKIVPKKSPERKQLEKEYKVLLRQQFKGCC